MFYYFKGIAIDARDFDRIKKEAESLGLSFFGNDSNQFHFILESSKDALPTPLVQLNTKSFVKIRDSGYLYSSEAPRTPDNFALTFGALNKAENALEMH